jgi:hypothetical protein
MRTLTRYFRFSFVEPHTVTEPFTAGLTEALPEEALAALDGVATDIGSPG